MVRVTQDFTTIPATVDYCVCETQAMCAQKHFASATKDVKKFIMNLSLCYS